MISPKGTHASILKRPISAAELFWELMTVLMFSNEGLLSENLPVSDDEGAFGVKCLLKHWSAGRAQCVLSVFLFPSNHSISQKAQLAGTTPPPPPPSTTQTVSLHFHNRHTRHILMRLDTHIVKPVPGVKNSSPHTQRLRGHTVFYGGGGGMGSPFTRPSQILWVLESRNFRLTLPTLRQRTSTDSWVLLYCYLLCVYTADLLCTWGVLDLKKKNHMVNWKKKKKVNIFISRNSKMYDITVFFIQGMNCCSSAVWHRKCGLEWH